MKYEASGNFINKLCSKTISLVHLSKSVWPLKMTIILLWAKRTGIESENLTVDQDD